MERLASQKEPDIDFNDVFGGPPKRSTSHERYSFTETSRRNSRSSEVDDEALLQRNPWSGVREKPVFGEEMVNRRKYPSDDFYEDIFRGDEALVSPRRSSNEVFGSGSGGLSPARPLPPRGDQFGSSLPAQVQFSLPAKLTRGTDAPAFSSGNRKYKEPISNIKGFQYTPSSPTYKSSPLSQEAPSVEMKLPDAQSKVKSDSKNSEVATLGNQFHFSIYKWASKGVPVLIPLRNLKSGKLRDAIKTEILSSYNETMEKSEGQDLKRNLSGNNKVHHAEGGSETISAMLSDERAKIKVASQDTQEAEKLEMKSLRSFLDTPEKEGKGKTKNSEHKDNAMKKATASETNEDLGRKVQKRDEKKSNLKKEELIQVKEPRLVDSKKVSKENIGRNKTKGKVTEFVKIFNQEKDLKTKVDVETRNQGSEMGSAKSEKADKEISSKAPQKNASIMLDKNLEEQKKQLPHLKTSVADMKGNVTDKKDEKASNSDSNPGKAKAIDDDIDDIFPETFTVKELSNDQDKPVQGDENYEDIQSSDARIRKWSRGKEGNIRSLLSTLQYVLWPGSGWKPVPLVDIIEGSAVKRSYQRALLCLHPDKLQQKGAADYQKYIAEKVFGILQEAWDQFNSLGLM